MRCILLVAVAEALYEEVKEKFAKDIERRGIKLEKSETRFWRTPFEGRPLFNRLIGEFSPTLLWTNSKHKKDRRKKIEEANNRVFVVFESEIYIIPLLNYLGHSGNRYAEILEKWLFSISSIIVSDEDKSLQLNNLYDNKIKSEIDNSNNNQEYEQGPLINTLPASKSDYLLSYLEVLEILCRIESKFVQVSNFDENKFSKKMINKTPNSKEITSILKTITTDYSKKFCENISSNVQHDPLLLYRMRRAIEAGISMFFSSEELQALCNYVWRENFIIKNLYQPFKPNHVSEWSANFEGTRWIVYYNVYPGNLLRKPTLGKAFMEFMPFGRVRYKSLNRELVGNYQLYKKNENFLFIKLFIGEIYNDDRYFIVYFGAKKPEIMLGQYMFLEQFISSNVLMERTQEKYTSFNAKHILENSTEYLSLNSSVQKYFSEGYLSGVVSSRKTEYFYLFENEVK